jgi:hypothetical protein
MRVFEKGKEPNQTNTSQETTLLCKKHHKPKHFNKKLGTSGAHLQS